MKTQRKVMYSHFESHDDCYIVRGEMGRTYDNPTKSSKARFAELFNRVARGRANVRSNIEVSISLANYPIFWMFER